MAHTLGMRIHATLALAVVAAAASTVAAEPVIERVAVVGRSSPAMRPGA